MAALKDHPVDDIDTISDNNEDVDYIYGQIHKQFGIPRCDPTIMLGVERRLTTVANTRYLEFLGTARAGAHGAAREGAARAGAARAGQSGRLKAAHFQ